MMGAFLAVTPAHAAQEAPGSFSISMSVPVVCDIQASDFVLSADRSVVAGTVNEYCNSSRGFQIIAAHRPLESGEQVDINYDGSVTELNMSGVSNVAFRAGARSSIVPVIISSPDLSKDLALSFAVTPV
ncbi:hypothetical protein FGU71_05100 [Erythrobacter insulae]|uniref:Uncharacterized protein n=1 Tax=Erythrobacter insulae TaxID=2584124 RepID=A0A547PAX2_9SPHN|nr:hypothetical protein [Erythrobacter insulae]TRD11285.1 hypothetical protein FGU71_05100 [Erythrobacter insulae]